MGIQGFYGFQRIQGFLGFQGNQCFQDGFQGFQDFRGELLSKAVYTVVVGKGNSLIHPLKCKQMAKYQKSSRPCIQIYRKILSASFHQI